MKTEETDREPDVDRINEERFLARQGTDNWQEEKDRIEYQQFKEEEIAEDYKSKIY